MFAMRCPADIILLPPSGAQCVVVHAGPADMEGVVDVVRVIDDGALVGRRALFGRPELAIAAEPAGILLAIPEFAIVVSSNALSSLVMAGSSRWFRAG